MVAGDYAKHLSANGGIANCGEHLGVFVAKEKYVDMCPPAWCFVPLEYATPEIVKGALDWMKAGRSNWPERE